MSSELVRFRPAETPDVIKTLLEQFVQQVSGPANRTALESCALVRYTTEALLAHMVTIPEVHENTLPAGRVFS